MTTREEYAEAAEECLYRASTFARVDPQFARYSLASKVLRALADGAVLCERRTDIRHMEERAIVTYTYVPLEPQP